MTNDNHTYDDSPEEEDDRKRVWTVRELLADSYERYLADERQEKLAEDIFVPKLKKPP